MNECFLKILCRLRHQPIGDASKSQMRYRQWPIGCSRLRRIQPPAKEVLKHLTIRKMVSFSCRNTAGSPYDSAGVKWMGGTLWFGVDGEANDRMCL